MFSDIAGYTAIMGRDEGEAMRALNSHRETLRSFLPKHNGRLIGEIGDGTLSSFHSAIDAVNCAREVQARVADNSELKLRIGIHLGDVLFANQTVVGDGVNIASRIHALAPPGGICLSSTVYDEIRNKPGITAKNLGEKQLKNVSRKIRIYLLTSEGAEADRHGRRKRWIWRAAIAALAGVAALFSYSPVRTDVLASAFILLPRILPRQFNRSYYEPKLAFTTTSDGIRIAYGTSGKGPPVVYVITWGTDLEHGDSSGTYGSVPYGVLGSSHTVVQYDGRGFGASDRGVRDFSMDARVRDLEAVVDALKLKRFALWGYSAGGPVPMVYAARHPERVTRLLLQETYAKYDLNLLSAADRHRIQSLMTLVATNYSNPPVLDLFNSYMWPEGNPVAWRVMSEMFRISATPEDYANFLVRTADDDVTEFARQIQVPTLIIHFRGDQMVPAELGKQLATLITGSRLVILEGRDHVVIPGTSEFEQAARVIRPYFDEDRDSTGK